MLPSHLLQFLTAYLTRVQTGGGTGPAPGLADTPGIKMQNRRVLRAVSLATFICCATLPAYAGGVRSSIEAANAAFSAAAAKGDGVALAGLYVADGQVMPAGSEPIRGTAAIQKFW